MGFFSEDMVGMLGVYQAETTELMGSLDAIVSRVEQEKRFTDEDVAELFRCAHTVKGSSAMMGLDALSTLTHRVEDLFDLLRGDPSLSEGRVPDILDRLYSFSDFVKDEVARMEDDGYTPADAQALIEEMSSYAAELAGEDAPTSGADAGSAAETDKPGEGVGADTTDAGPGGQAEAGGVVMKIAFKPDVPMVNARALVIVRQLRAKTKVHSHVPEDLTDTQAAQTIAQDGLLVVMDAADVDAAKGLLAKNSFIQRIDVLDEPTAAPATAVSAPKARGGQPSPPAEKFITLRWSNVHELQDMAGEFLLHVSRLKTLADGMPEGSGMRATVSQTARLVDELVYQVNKMAMVSMSAMVPQLSRMVRDMCRNSGKQVSFEVQGGNIEIDRNLYNSISDPLLHIIRNAVDHGIEATEERLASGKDARGTVSLSIENLGARVAFRISDDGRGIDTDTVLAKAEAAGMLERPASSYTREEVLHMVMLAGLSTKKEVTQYSGRGVGMDVVNAVVRDFGGRVEIESEPGRGTSMTLFMPVAVTSVQCLCFRIGDSLYHMPLFNLNKIFTAQEAGELVSDFEGSVLFDYDKRQIPVLDTHRVLACSGDANFYIVCHSLDDEFVICVDDVLGEFSCASKALPSCLGAEWQETCAVRNAAIMDDGTVGYVLNAALLAGFAQGRKAIATTTSWENEELPSPTPDPGAGMSLPSWAFVFTLGDEWCAVAADQVERLIPLPTCSRTPRAYPYLVGLTNYRNHAIAVYDLATSAGVKGRCLYALVVEDATGEFVGLTISSAIGIRSLDGATMAEEQREPRAFAAGWHTTVTVKANLKEPDITLIAR